MVQSIPFVDANRDDDARSCLGTAVHACVYNSLHPNRSPRLSYLFWKVADKTEKYQKRKTDKHEKDEQAVYATRHSSGQKSNGFTVDLRDQTACFAR